MQILISGNYTSYIFTLLYMYYLAQSQGQLYSIIIFVRTCVHFYLFILNRLARKILPGKKFQVKQKNRSSCSKNKPSLKLGFYLCLGWEKKQLIYYFLCMKERRSQLEEGGGNPTSSSALTSAQNRQLSLCQRPGKVTLENKLKPLPIVMQPYH